ncbi:MAG: helix-turn-helix domain-containing protein [Chloroflexi bacterium]|nr:helix-turn-helix domain-containing protein [Chloroflexota bacterium]
MFISTNNISIIPFSQNPPGTGRARTIPRGQKGGTPFQSNQRNRLKNKKSVFVKGEHPIDVRLKELGLTRHDLAKRVHRTAQTINLYCNRRLMIDPDSYLGREFCRVLQTDFSFLIMGVRNNPGS